MATTPPAPSADAPNAPLDDHDALPPGTRFGELEILRVLGSGGFGIVYLAQDHALERNVALKEYMPSSLAGRGKGQMVSIRSGAHTETYALGLRSFVNEARLLARFNHPSLVKVYRFWEENGTAYMVMPYLQGRTLREVRRAMSTTPSEAWIRSVLGPMLDALELLHSEDVYHRDIAPDNILLPPGELPVLLDFGAARRAIGDRTQTFTAILKPSYAPIEQYAEVIQLRQGPWTDIYALGAVVYYLLRGSPPPPATARAVQDDEPLLTPDQNPGASAPFLAAIEWALAIRPADRPQSIAALRDAIEGRADVPPRARPGTTVSNRTMMSPPAEESAFAPTMPADFRGDPITLEPTRPMTVPPSQPYRQPMVEPITLPDPALYMHTRPGATVMPATPTADTPPPGTRRLGVWAVAGVLAVVGLGAMAAWIGGGRGPSNQVAGPLPAASAPADPAALPPSSNLPAVASVAPTTASTRAAGATASPSTSDAPVGRATARLDKTAGAASVPARAMFASAPDTGARSMPQDRPHDRPGRPGDSASNAFAHEVRPADHHHVPPREDNPHPQNTVAQPVPATTAPVVAAPQGPASPREACGNRVFLALAVCMEEQCERPRFKSHRQCDRVHEIIERRRRGESGG